MMRPTLEMIRVLENAKASKRLLDGSEGRVEFGDKILARALDLGGKADD